jgi:seryl-tRNA synthetase
MNPASFGLQSAVCDCCYYALRGRTDYHNTLYTTRNKVFRNECSPTGSLDRLTSFTVRDIMFVGGQEFVMAERERMLGLAREFLAELDLDSALASANDPFFAGDALIKAVFQNAAELKYELLARLPFSGRDLAIGSVNLHQDYFGRAFGITRPDGQPVWSGCLGIGFERLVYAVYAQFGTVVKTWPAHLRAMAEA